MDEQGRFIVKPNDCGSSDGVSLVAMNRLEKAIQTHENAHSSTLHLKCDWKSILRKNNRQ